ncbi:nuclear transport factor 2 family protein [Pararhizobium antarcticum]|nr:nuclear transport factor 2 family protein [Pararhizobium antarcticum]
MTATDGLIRTAFDAYNRRDSMSLLAMLPDDIVWPGDVGMLKGKDALQAYWQRQWATTRTHDTVVDVREMGGGYVVVSLSQTVETLDGVPISSGHLHYGFVVRDGLIQALKTRKA